LTLCRVSSDKQGAAVAVRLWHGIRETWQVLVDVLWLACPQTCGPGPAASRL
jgi:hypothetical protein